MFQPKVSARFAVPLAALSIAVVGFSSRALPRDIILLSASNRKFFIRFIFFKDFRAIPEGFRCVYGVQRFWSVFFVLLSRILLRCPYCEIVFLRNYILIDLDKFITWQASRMRSGCL